ncbi:MAG: CoA-binding protein [Deltaproteobacteria bacterium]|nr:CoA-binding protein [Deltaproteobacteria bacterium]
MTAHRALPSHFRDNLRGFFDAQSIAVIGTFREGWFGGSVVITSLFNAGYKGKIYPIHPTHKEVHGLRVYPTVSDIQGGIDLAILMINAQHVPQVLRECAEKDVKAVIVVADGFAERDQRGVLLQREIVDIAHRSGMRIIGPNTAGIVNTTNGLNMCPYDAGYYKLRKGSVAICAQTGMTNPQAFPYHDLRFGVSKICDFGNKCDVDECDLLEYLEEDPATSVISMYLESIAQGRRFLEVASRVTRKKPVLLLKSGKSQEGARASASHTGSLAMDDRIFEAACAQAGALRLERFNDLFEIPKVFAYQPLPQGNRMAIITITGGVGVLSIDEGANYGLALSTLSPRTREFLNDIFPNLGEIPVDIGPPAAAIKDFPSRYPEIFNAVMADEHVDCLFNILWVDHIGRLVDLYETVYKQIKDTYQKPMVTWLYGPNMAYVDELRQRMEELGFPVFPDPETSIRALGMALRFRNLTPRN